MKNKNIILLIALFTISACSPSLNGEANLDGDNKLNQKRSEWAQFEDVRTKKELSIFDEDSSQL